MPHREHRDDTQRLACGVTSPLMLRTRRPRIPVAKFVDARALGGAQRPAGTSVPDQPARRLYLLNPELFSQQSSGASDKEARSNGSAFLLRGQDGLRASPCATLAVFHVSSKRLLGRRLCSLKWPCVPRCRRRPGSGRREPSPDSRGSPERGAWTGQANALGAAQCLPHREHDEEHPQTRVRTMTHEIQTDAAPADSRREGRRCG